MQPIYDLQILNLISIVENPELSSQLNSEKKLNLCYHKYICQSDSKLRRFN